MVEETEGVQETEADDEAEEEERIPADDLVYVIALDAFVGKTKDESYDIHTLMGREPARNYLSTRGYRPATIKGFINGMGYTKVMRFTAAPGQPQICKDDDGQKCLNSFVPSKLAPTPVEFPTITKLLDYLTVNDTAGKAWLLNWMAAKAQHPAKLLPTAVALLGAAGTGKSTFVRVMMEIIGAHNCVTLGQNLLESSFTSSWAGKCFINIDEAVSSEHAIGVSYKVKRVITNEVVEYHAKGRDPIAVKNCGAWVFTSNSQLAIREDEDDRRITSFVQPARPAQEYVDMLKDSFDGTTPTEAFSREIAGLYHHLLSLPVDRKMLTSPYANDAKKEIATLSRNSAEDFLAELTEHGLPMIEDELAPANKYDDPVQVPKSGDEMVVDGRSWRTVSKPGLYQLYTRFAKQYGQKALGKNRFFAVARQKYGFDEERRDNKRFVKVWWAVQTPPNMPAAKGAQ